MGIFSKSKKHLHTSEKQSAILEAPQAAGCDHHMPPQPDYSNTSYSYTNGFTTPPSWPMTPPPPYPPSPYQPYQQIFVSNYILPPPQPSSCGQKLKTKLQSASMVHLPQLGPNLPSCIPGAQIFNDVLPHWHQQGTQYLHHNPVLYDLIGSKFNSVVTSIDGEQFSGNENDLWVQAPALQDNTQALVVANTKGGLKDKSKNNSKNDIGCPISAKFTSSNYFTKVSQYENSRLPLDLPIVKLYIPTFPLLCVAAKYSEHVYTKPSGKERETFVDADRRMGTKCMVIKSVPMDDMNVIVFAIRGSWSFSDWVVNFNSSPESPAGFLDDPGNFCHAGFLSVARKMISPVAARLRNLLAEDPRRSACSLLITGHSAGGAVAALLYSHMVAASRETESELNILSGYFKRIHCITFGAPPLSLLPLVKPERRELKKSLFLSFVNEGDPVARADKAYVNSLLKLYATATPNNLKTDAAANSSNKLRPLLNGNKAASSSAVTINKVRPPGPTRTNSAPAVPPSAPIWPIPPSTLSNAGRLILLRSVPVPNNGKKKSGILDSASRMDDGVQARIVTDEQLRGVVWGDPVCHMMTLYTRRIEVLATNAVIGRG